MIDVETYIAVSGDDYLKIAKKFYGNNYSGYITALQNANPKYPGLGVFLGGEVLNIPDIGQQAPITAPITYQTYETKSGDTFDLIAYQQLGDVIYTKDLMEVNPAYISTVIFSSGIVLNLPTITPASTTAVNLPPWRS